MKILGWILFVLGAVMLILFGFFEVNVPGLIFGSALLVSGSVFAAAAYLAKELT